MNDENKAETKDSALQGNDESYTLDSEEFKRRIAERRRKLLESQDFTKTPEEENEDRLSAEPTEIQGRTDDGYTFDPEDTEDPENYPFTEADDQIKPKKVKKGENNPNPSPLN